ncbi:hypothetical protein M378DRAFT_169455 [Amanita muscaria Koide BX008]|uniref:Uncharacterized protein n=1 Tax=Amanita muscaria (strain Koide BX008) TaxID=946122 RepID=A0A0C2S910_AMAMK|nr:hypothetical protein M378DRAFT_169455 [Amanita muscaria Koide BX008]
MLVAWRREWGGETSALCNAYFPSAPCSCLNNVVAPLGLAYSTEYVDSEMWTRCRFARIFPEKGFVLMCVDSIRLLGTCVSLRLMFTFPCRKK